MAGQFPDSAGPWAAPDDDDEFSLRLSGVGGHLQYLHRFRVVALHRCQPRRRQTDRRISFLPTAFGQCRVVPGQRARGNAHDLCAYREEKGSRRLVGQRSERLSFDAAGLWVRAVDCRGVVGHTGASDAAGQRQAGQFAGENSRSHRPGSSRFREALAGQQRWQANLCL